MATFVAGRGYKEVLPLLVLASQWKEEYGDREGHGQEVAPILIHALSVSSLTQVFLFPKAFPVLSIQLHRANVTLLRTAVQDACHPGTCQALPRKDAVSVTMPSQPWTESLAGALVESSACHWHAAPPIPRQAWQHAQSGIRGAGARNPRAANHTDVRNSLIRALSDQLGPTGPTAAASSACPCRTATALEQEGLGTRRPHNRTSGAEAAYACHQPGHSCRLL